MKKFISGLTLTSLMSPALVFGLNLTVNNQWYDVITIKEGVLSPIEDNVTTNQSISHYMFAIANFKAYYVDRHGMWAEIPDCSISSSTKSTKVNITYNVESPTIPQCTITN